MPDQTPDLIDTLVDSHRRFRAFLEQRVENAADAEDILQAAYLKGVARGETVREHESVVAWFYRLLRNAVVDHYRHRGAEGRALTQAAGFSEYVEEPEPEVERAICQCVHDLFPTLREDYARLLQRVDLEDASIAQVADESGMSSNNVRVKLHRARAALRKQLELSCGSCTEHGCLDCTCRTSGQHPH
jgi:RNA polymerase sigma-70 factor (ECF subfamily)